MRGKRTGSVAASAYPQLEGEEVMMHGLLEEILTGSKKETISRLRKNLHFNRSHSLGERLRKELLDVAIVVYVQKSSFSRQDIDNIAKIVLDALKKPSKEDGCPYFIEHDRQVVRLLI